MARYDLETLLKNIKSVIVSDFNTKITEINTEKNDGITLPTFDTNAVVFNMDKKWMNYNPSIMIQTIDNQGISNANTRSKNLIINVALIYSNINIDGENLQWMMLRFQRALEEIFEAKFSSRLFLGRLTIQSLPTLEFTEETKTYNMTGVDLITTFA